MVSKAAESTGRHWHALCLVVLPATPQPSAESRESVEQLLLSLSRRGLTVHRCRDCFEAMAEVVCHERHRRQGTTRDPLVVVLIDPNEQPFAEGLFNAALRQGSTAVFWEFQGGASARLIAYRPHGAPRAEAPLSLTPPPTPMVARGVSVTPAERPALRLTPDPEPPVLRIAPMDADVESVGSDAARSSGSSAGGAALLTDEELSMLLGEGPDGSFPGGARA